MFTELVIIYSTVTAIYNYEKTPLMTACCRWPDKLSLIMSGLSSKVWCVMTLKAFFRSKHTGQIKDFLFNMTHHPE